MCGLTGFWGPPGAEEELAARVTAMADRIRHRGPDAGGSWVDAAAGLALGHRRLAIVDLSPNGAQPMASADGRWLLAYNGEIYNAPELRRELEAEGRRFRGHSDTEVLVEGCAAWGAERTVTRLIGMFAFALWDRRERTLTLVRDRLGIKPMYWGRVAGVLFFGSQPKSFFAHPAWRPEIDREAVDLVLRHSYVPAPRSIYRGLAQLLPGHLATIDAGGGVSERCYWDARALADPARVEAWEPQAAVAHLDELLRDAVGRRMVADVPLGAFLSGGVDSSTVVALMQAQSDRPVRSFSIGFDERGYDESAHARAVAEHLGTDHTELRVAPADALRLIPELPEHYDEPFADSSQIPTYLVSALTRESVTVALSGDGGDELFAGYNRYPLAGRIRAFYRRLPAVVRLALAGALRSPSPAAWDRFTRLLPRRLVPPLLGDKLHKLGGALSLADADAIFPLLVSFWQGESGLVRGVPAAGAGYPEIRIDGASARFMEEMQLADLLTYLPHDILTKVDRASMAVALEARVPLIDHRVVEWSWTLPSELKLRDGVTKWVLRQVLYRYVPRELIERPKMGFGVPIGPWLRGPLRDWAEALLDERALEEGGLFDPAPIRRRWNEHLNGSRNWQYELWNVLMVRAWQQRWLDGAR